MASRLVEAVALGQLLAALIAGSAIASAFLASRGISLPILQSSTVYVLLAVVYGGSLLRHRPQPALHHDWRAYALLAALDVGACREEGLQPFSAPACCLRSPALRL